MVIKNDTESLIIIPTEKGNIILEPGYNKVEGSRWMKVRDLQIEKINSGKIIEMKE